MIRLAVLYTALALAANPALADRAALEALRGQAMQKLVFSEPLAVPDVEFSDPEGGTFKLSDWHGKWVVVNFWATWCAPCRHEMPGLDRLQGELGGDDFTVIAVATGRNAGIDRFLAEIGVTRLPVFLDPDSDLAHGFGVMGLPVSVILDPEGREVARLIGACDWAGPEALAILTALIAGD